MTASHQLTPSQARYIQEHKERRRRLAAKAKPDKPLVCLSASARAEAFERPVIKLLPAVVPESATEWAARQIQRYEPWFLIEEEIDPPATVRPSINLIQRMTAKHYELTVSDIISEVRLAPVVRARQVAVYLSKTMTLRSLPEIGRRFGGRDHSTILFSVRKIAGLLKTDQALSEKVESIRSDVVAST